MAVTPLAETKTLPGLKLPTTLVLAVPKPITINVPGIHATLQEGFLSAEYATRLMGILEKQAKWNHPLHHHKRHNANYGDPGICYDLKIGDQVIHRPVHDWKDLPDLMYVRDLISFTTRTKYNYVVIQCYPYHDVGIPAHRDREVAPGTVISGVSLGAARDLILAPNRSQNSYTLTCTHGSLYNMWPPTNDQATHAVGRGKEGDGPRISLTYRYQIPPSSS